MDGNILNSSGVHVAAIREGLAYNLQGSLLYRIVGANIYKISGELVGHFSDGKLPNKRLDKTTDRLFS